jgi:hypothetical protein
VRVGLGCGEGGGHGEHGGWCVIHARRWHWEDPARAVVSRVYFFIPFLDAMLMLYII